MVFVMGDVHSEDSKKNEKDTMELKACLHGACLLKKLTAKCHLVTS